MQPCQYHLTFFLEVAHHMGDSYPVGHPNRRVHGHTYHGEWIIVGTANASGVVLELDEAKKILERVVELYDHRLLNDIAGLETPTTEMMAFKMYSDLKALESRTVAVELYRPSVGLRIRYPAPGSHV